MFITAFIGYFFDISFGIALSLMFSVLKEIHDYKIKKEDFEARDLIADIMGILFGIAIILESFSLEIDVKPCLSSG